MEDTWNKCNNKLMAPPNQQLTKHISEIIKEPEKYLAGLQKQKQKKPPNPNNTDPSLFFLQHIK